MMDIFLKFCCSRRDKNDDQASDRMLDQQGADPRGLNSFLDQRRNRSETIDQHSKIQVSHQFEHHDEMSIEHRGCQILVTIEASQPLESQNLIEHSHADAVSHDALHSSPQRVRKRISKNQSSKCSRRNIKLWEQAEDAKLMKYHQEFQGDWKQIAQMIPGRNISQCSQRWRRMNPQPVLRFVYHQIKPKWSVREDNQVVSMVAKYGKNWGLIAKSMQGRTGKQIRERYLNKLDPKLNISGWTEDEDQIILHMSQTLGTKWSKIAAALKGRSENMVKNRYYTYIKRVKLGQTNPYQIVYNQINQVIKEEEGNSCYSDDRESDTESQKSSSSSQINMSKIDFYIQEEEPQRRPYITDENSYWNII